MCQRTHTSKGVEVGWHFTHLVRFKHKLKITGLVRRWTWRIGSHHIVFANLCAYGYMSSYGETKWYILAFMKCNESNVRPYKDKISMMIFRVVLATWNSSPFTFVSWRISNFWNNGNDFMRMGVAQSLRAYRRARPRFFGTPGSIFRSSNPEQSNFQGRCPPSGLRL